MAKTSGLYQIEQVVWRAIHENELEERHFRKMLQLAFNGVRELYRGALRGEETWVKVTPDDINRIDLPQDLEEFVGLGIPYGGKIWFLTERKDIIATYTESGVDQSLDASDGEGVNLPTNQFESIHSTGGVNLYGYFKIDWSARQIIVNATSRDELILVYYTSGIYTDQITYIPTRAAEALIAYMMWKYSLGKVKMPRDIPVAQFWEEQYNREAKKLTKREMFNNGAKGIRDTLSATKSLLRR